MWITVLYKNTIYTDSVALIYSPSPEYPAACSRDDQAPPKATARQGWRGERAEA